MAARPDEGLFADVESVIDADVDGEVGEAAGIYQWSQQLVPQTVEGILDRLAMQAELAVPARAGLAEPTKLQTPLRRKPPAVPPKVGKKIQTRAKSRR
jgi:hypothetical protein